MKRALNLAVYVTMLVFWVKAFIADWGSAGAFLLLLAGVHVAYFAARAIWGRQRRV
jgi:hypothetical protein